MTQVSTEEHKRSELRREHRTGVDVRREEKRTAQERRGDERRGERRGESIKLNSRPEKLCGPLLPRPLCRLGGGPLTREGQRPSFRPLTL